MEVEADSRRSNDDTRLTATLCGGRFFRVTE